jgi:drug/metabolite transporter (DMT)-like permease
MSLDPTVTALVLLSALLHASWNAVAKSSSDRSLTLALVLGVSAVLGAIASPFIAPPEPEALPFLAVSSCFHALYQIFLLQAYRFGDLSQVYPIARGFAPILVALLAAAFAGETPTLLQAAGVGLASLSIASLALERRGGASPGVGRSIAAAFATAAMIGSYTFLDGQGVRHAGGALRYVAWNLWATALPFCITALWLGRARLRAFLARDGWRAAAGGVVAALGYGIVLWAMEHGAMAGVAALRETSVVFAALIGTLMLGEDFGARRILAALGVAAGAILLQAG